MPEIPPLVTGKNVPAHSFGLADSLRPMHDRIELIIFLALDLTKLVK